MKLTAKDERMLAKVHPDLVKVVRAAAAQTSMPFTVLEGARSLEQQKKNKAKGVSWTLNSRHIPGKDGYAHAVDLCPLVNGSVSWDWADYHRLAPIMKAAARSVGVTVKWGGDWKRTPDGPHWELPRAMYAAMGGNFHEEDGCGMAHQMVGDDGPAMTGIPGAAPGSAPPPTGPGKWLTAILGSGGVGSLAGFGYGMEWMSLAVLMGGLVLITVGILIAIGRERRERLWDSLFGAKQ